MVQPLWREDPSAGKQLAYQPLHSWRASAGAESGPVSFSVNLSYTGERTTLDIFDKLPDYLLADASITYKTALWGREVTLSGVVKNITNTRYQNVKFYAMAPLNYMVNVVFSF
jgi:outer membrane receptor protein involved in Fe transport